MDEGERTQPGTPAQPPDDADQEAPSAPIEPEPAATPFAPVAPVAPVAPPEPPPLVPWTAAKPPPAGPINGWVAGQEPSVAAPPADKPPTTASRVLRAIAWIVGIGAMLFFGRIYALIFGGGDLSPEKAGEVVGYLLGALLIAFGIRWLFVRFGTGKGLISPWVPVVATLILLLNLGQYARQPTTAVAPKPEPTSRATPAGSPRDVDEFLVIGDPYGMERASAEEVTDFGKAMGAFSDKTEVRRITRDGVVEGFYVVVDSGSSVPVKSLAAFELGLKTQEGIETERATLGGHEVVIANVPDDDVAFVSWLEVPRILVVYGIDEASARSMATAVINAYK